MKMLKIDPETADLAMLIERGTELHGHLGPFLVAGIRMGLLALRELGSPGYVGLRAESRAGRVTPLSCLNDGIQIGSGCTAGKGNLLIVSADGPHVRFTTEDDRSIEIELRPEIISAFAGTDPIEKAREVEAIGDEELFTWTLSP
jgi:formylmethanofuran dehydrogenase subunit E